jgi:hypothetical protein
MPKPSRRELFQRGGALLARRQFDGEIIVLCVLLSQVQAEPAGLGGDIGKRRLSLTIPHYAVVAALFTEVHKVLAPSWLRRRPIVACQRDILPAPRQYTLILTGSDS